jgi:germination protein M
MRPARRSLGALIGVVAALVAVGCAYTSKPTTNPTTTPATTPSATGVTSSTGPPLATTTTQVEAETADVRVYYLQSDTLGVAHRTITATPRVAAAAMTELLAGPTPADSAAGLTTAIPAGTRLLGVTIADGTATIDLTPTFESGGGSLSMAARLAQVTYTLTQFPSVARVVFSLDGKPVTVFGGEGIILDHPATRASFETLTPAILVEYPGRDWAVQSPLRIAGSANVFEAQFQAELTDASGVVIARQAIHATAGTGTRGTFDTTLPFTVTASGPGLLTVFDTSPKDGTRIDVVQLPLQLVAP